MPGALGVSYGRVRWLSVSSQTALVLHISQRKEEGVSCLPFATLDSGSLYQNYIVERDREAQRGSATCLTAHSRVGSRGSLPPG